MRLSRVLLLALILVILPLGGCNPTSNNDSADLGIENSQLKQELGTVKGDKAYFESALEQLKAEAKSQYDNLSANYSKLKATVDKQQADYNLLRASCDSLNASYNKAIIDYNSLKTTYDKLKADSLQYDVVLAEQKASYNSLNVSYNSLKTTYDALLISYNSLLQGGASNTSASILKKGLRLVAQDSQYLGILDSQFASESIFNEFGKYGSEFSSTSIWNDFSNYGSQFSSLSAFNDLASKPPMLYDGDKFICYVTTNTVKNPRVSPYALIVFAESMGWR